MKFNSQKYIELALSKDIGRGALEYPYRHKDRLIGCDGHRLHMITGLSTVEKGLVMSTDGSDRQYPDYELAMPKQERFISAMKVEKRDIKRLKAMVDLISVEALPVCKLTTESNKLIIQHENQAGTVNASIVIEMENAPKTEGVSIGVNLKYLYQALIQDVQMDLYVDADKALILKCEQPSVMSYALLMGARL